MMNNEPKKIPLRGALGWILLSVFFISGSSTLALFYYYYIREMHASDDAYRIVAIVQTTPNKEGLKNSYLAELLGLSTDRPSNLYRFNCNEARRTLLAHPLIKEAKVKKIKPGTIYVDYVLRQPVAFLADASNTAIDWEGALFPFKPFFTPKNLPEVVLGEQSQEKNEIKLALTILQLFSQQRRIGTHLQRVDVSHAFATSYGQRQIILTLEENTEQQYQNRQMVVTTPYILRLNSDSFEQCLANYYVLHDELVKKTQFPQDTKDRVIKQPVKIIDLRLPQLAFVR